MFTGSLFSQGSGGGSVLLRHFVLRHSAPSSSSSPLWAGISFWCRQQVATHLCLVWRVSVIPCLVWQVIEDPPTGSGSTVWWTDMMVWLCVFSFLCLVPVEVRSAQLLQEGGYESYVHDAHTLVKTHTHTFSVHLFSVRNRTQPVCLCEQNISSLTVVSWRSSNTHLISSSRWLSVSLCLCPGIGRSLFLFPPPAQVWGRSFLRVTCSKSCLTDWDASWSRYTHLSDPYHTCVMTQRLTLMTSCVFSHTSLTCCWQLFCPDCCPSTTRCCTNTCSTPTYTCLTAPGRSSPSSSGWDTERQTGISLSLWRLM